MGAAITGWGTALPRREVTNEELAESLDVSPDWIFERTGIRTRRLAADEDSAASLATIAARQALEADASAERQELLVERAVEGDHGHGSQSLRKTPTTLPRI